MTISPLAISVRIMIWRFAMSLPVARKQIALIPNAMVVEGV